MIVDISNDNLKLARGLLERVALIASDKYKRVARFAFAIQTCLGGDNARHWVYRNNGIQCACSPLDDESTYGFRRTRDQRQERLRRGIYKSSVRLPWLDHQDQWLALGIQPRQPVLPKAVKNLNTS